MRQRVLVARDIVFKPAEFTIAFAAKRLSAPNEAAAAQGRQGARPAGRSAAMDAIVRTPAVKAGALSVSYRALDPARQLRFTGGREAAACGANQAHRSLRSMTSWGGSENSRSMTAVTTAHCTIHVLTPMRFSMLGSPATRGATSKRGAVPRFRARMKVSSSPTSSGVGRRGKPSLGTTQSCMRVISTSTRVGWTQIGCSVRACRGC